MMSSANIRSAAMLALIPLLAVAILQLSTGVSFAAECSESEIWDCVHEFLDCTDSCEECEEAFVECIEACGSSPGQGNQCV